MIKLRDLLNEEFTAVSNKSGKTVVFKDKDSRDAAVKAGTHSDDEESGKDEPKGEKKPNMFSKDAGYDSSDAKSDSKLSLSKRGPGFDMTAASKLEDELGGGISDLTDDGVITFSFGENDKETSLYFGVEDGQYVVSVENPYGDDFGDEEYFDNEADAIAHAKELANKYSKELGGSSNTNKYDKDSDENDFENALEGDGFSWYDGGSLEGVSTFGDENGNTVAIAAGDVYDKKSAFVVSGFNEDDPADVKGTKEFDSKEEAIAYAKKLAQKLKSSNEGTIKLMNLLRK